MCLNPLFVPSKAKDARPGQRQGVRCNECVECLAENQREWIYRLEKEQETSEHSFFATLTYDPAYVPLIDSVTKEILPYKEWLKQKRLNNCEFAISIKDIQDYWKRVRDALPGVELKHYTCLEYGDEFDRPHAHYVVFYDDCDPAKFEQAAEAKWHNGYVRFDAICDANIRYVTKYLKKGDKEAAPTDISPDPCSLKSHGIGVKGFFADEKKYQQYYNELLEYADKTNDYSVLPKTERLLCVQTRNGSKLPLPRYFRRKYYPKQEFLTEQIIEDEQRRISKRDQAIKRQVQDLRCQGYYLDEQEAWKRASESFDSQRIRRDVYNAQSRRKG